MHIPNGFLDPKISAGLGFASAGALAYCFNRVREAATAPVAQEAFATAGRAASNIVGQARRAVTSSGRSLLLRMAMIATLIFFAQMFDFPVTHGTTGHLLGCALAAICLGPWAGALTMAGVLTAQSVFLGDGGLWALGANTFNMAIIGTVGAYYTYVAFRKLLPGRFSFYAGVICASWLSVVAAAAATALEVGFSGTDRVGWTLSSMISVHAVVGLAEALATIAILGLLQKTFHDDESGQF